MRYWENTKRLSIDIISLFRIIEEVLKFKPITLEKAMSGELDIEKYLQDKVLSTLMSEMIASGVMSASDAYFPDIKIIEVYLDRDNTIDVKNRFQLTQVQRKKQNDRKRSKKNGRCKKSA